MKYKIEDWAGNRLWTNFSFDSFDEGWAWLHEQDPEPDQDDDTWHNAWYDDYFVVPIHECTCEQGDCDYHSGYQDGVRDAQQALMERFGINLEV